MNAGLQKKGEEEIEEEVRWGKNKGGIFRNPLFQETAKKRGRKKRKKTKETSSVPCRVFAIFFTLAAVAVVASFQNIQITFREGKQFPP